jgi:hypothetical protein
MVHFRRKAANDSLASLLSLPIVPCIFNLLVATWAITFVVIDQINTIADSTSFWTTIINVSTDELLCGVIYVRCVTALAIASVVLDMVNTITMRPTSVSDTIINILA